MELGDMTPHELKSLEGRMRRAIEDIVSLKEQRMDLDKRISEKQAEIDKYREMFERVKKSPKKVTVSEHALLRYLERVKRVDVTKATKEVLPDNFHDMALSQNGIIVIGNSHRVWVRNGIVSTVESLLENKGRKNKVKPWATEAEDEF